MNRRPFRRGIITGLLAPLAFVAATLYWIYRATGKIPFPVRRAAKDELTIGLIEPGEVPGHWQPWRDEIEPIVERAKSTIAQLVSDVRRD
ncbi:MAG: hypothetical protein JXA74_16865 [Anaerolineae bacterium]|nr:hypothetical protein [Anaerolineae bacterium]